MNTNQPVPENIVIDDRTEDSDEQLPSVDSFSSMPGDYKIIARNLNWVISPGDRMTIEVYITGYGTIKQNKLGIYESANIIDCENEKSILTSFNGKKGGSFSELGIILKIPDTYFYIAKKENLSIKSEVNSKGAPIELRLKTKDNITPGIYSIDFYLTYFNGKEWRVSKQQAKFKIQNFFERNEGTLKWLTILGSLAAFIVIGEFFYKLYRLYYC